MTDQTTIEPTVEQVAENRRLEALDRAISYHTIREGGPGDVVATATVFETYLRGSTWAAECEEFGCADTGETT